MRFALLTFALFVTASCGGYTASLPDGGRGRVNCNPSAISVPVTVLDRLGNPAPEAVVSVEYTSYAQSENIIADTRGVAVVKDQHGPGLVRVQGDVNAIKTNVGEFNFIGTECSESVSPRSLTLQLR